MTRLLVAAVLGLLALAPGAAKAQLFSPGDLARAHRDLNDDGSCTKCHSSGRQVETQLCVDCHDDIGRQRNRGVGLHGTEFKKDSCGHCHVEHRGLSHELVRWPGGSEKRFDHHMTGFDLRGAHRKTECNDCHDRKNRRGAHTFLGLERSCNSCHGEEDVHDGRFGERCNDCHNESKWTGADLDQVDHDLTRFALRGKHQKVECVECHEEPPKYRELEFQTCGSCHEDPHEGRLGKTCVKCHTERGWDQLTMKRSAHPGLRITAGHNPVACKTCHDQGADRSPTAGARCVSCHAAVHEAPFGNRCESCHASIRWMGLPDELGRKVHARTVFPLVGEHEDAKCEGCHLPSMPRAKRYRGLDYQLCSHCHQDPHGGELAYLGNGDCSSCHDPHGFRPTLFTVEQHADCAFALTGRHVAVPCAQCHQGEAPRLDWNVPQHACANCHDNPHGDQFAKEMAEGGCASCHNPIAWNLPNIDHSTWPLTGAHEVAACASCHDATEEDRRSGSGSSYRGVPRECEGCHQDVHAGQFRMSDPVRPCTDCHTTTQFGIERFDHTALAGYALDGKHAQVQCESCHPVAVLRDGQSAHLYRLGYSECSDCHADPHAEAGP